MTDRKKMIEALAKVIYCTEGIGRLPAPWTCAGDVHEKEWAFLRNEYAKPAAGVLDLVRPKQLVWHRSDMSGWNSDYHTLPTAYTVRCADENGWKWACLGRGSYGWEPEPEAAQAAVQAYADAAWLASLPLADIIGGE